MPVARDELGFTALDPRECPENFAGPLCACFYCLLETSYSASGIVRRPLIDPMSIRKNTVSIDRSLVCSRLCARGFRHHSEYCASCSSACSCWAVYSGSRSSKYVPVTITLSQLDRFPISSACRQT